MATNKNALIRYKTIDECLQNTARRWTLEDLIEACSDALYEFEGKEQMVGKRTIQLDIQNMRSEKLGYNAPIEVYDHKFYRYTDPSYSIKNNPITPNDIETMRQALQLLKEFKDFSFFADMNGILHRLEDSVLQKEKTRPIIHLDKNESLKGLEFIDIIYQSIQQKKVLQIKYKSFKARAVNVLSIHPQLLKEYNNRWFLIGLSKETLLTLALDRIETISQTHLPYIDKGIDANEYFKNVIGVTVGQGAAVEEVIFWVNKENAPYVKTKPFHHSQQIIEEIPSGTIFKIEVQYNLELERLILGFANAITIIHPVKLKKRILFLLRKAVENYTEKSEFEKNQ